MSETSLLDVMFRSLRASARLIGAGAEANRVLELDGVTAAIVPSTPDRSVQRVELVPRRLERVHGVLVAVTRPNRPRPHASLVVGGPCAPVPRPRRNGGGSPAGCCTGR